MGYLYLYLYGTGILRVRYTRSIYESSFEHLRARWLMVSLVIWHITTQANEFRSRVRDSDGHWQCGGLVCRLNDLITNQPAV